MKPEEIIELIVILSTVGFSIYSVYRYIIRRRRRLRFVASQDIVAFQPDFRESEEFKTIAPKEPPPKPVLKAQKEQIEMPSGEQVESMRDQLLEMLENNADMDEIDKKGFKFLEWEFWEKIEKLSLSDEEKIELVQNVLSLPPADRIEIIDGMLELQLSDEENPIL